MSLSDCPKCWNTPCTCGHEWEQWNTESLREMVTMLKAIIKNRSGSAPIWEDRDTPYEAEIDASHPLKSRDWKRYQKAVELVGAKHSKYALVDLVNWLLSRGPEL